MRQLVVLLAAALTGCTSTVLAEPLIHVSPYLALYRLRGDTSVQTPGAQPGQATDNPPQSLSTFGQDRFREDVGARVDIGDGFGGFRAEYFRLDNDTTQTGVLQDDYGALQAGESVSMQARMDELRLGYVEPLVDVRTSWRGEDLRLRFGAGGVFATRRVDLRARNDTNTAQQEADFDGDVAYVAVRARASWMNVSFDLDYAVAPEFLVLGGDIDGLSQDLEARVSYQLPQRDIQLFGGLRYSELSSNGSADGLRFDTDLVLDGFQLGVQVTF